MANTAKDKIRKGLDSQSGYLSKSDTRQPPRLLNLVGKKHTISSIHLNQRKAVEAYNKLRQLAAKASENMAGLEHDIRQFWDDRAWENDEVNGVPVRRQIMTTAEIKRNVDRDIKRAQDAVNQETAAELEPLMAAIREAKSQNAAFRKGAKSPYGMLLSETVGAERAQLAESLAAEGVVAIEDAMARALGDNDRLTAAAACIAYDKLSDEQKQLCSYTRDDVAEAIIWNDWQAKQIALEKTLYAVGMAEVLADQIAGKKNTAKIGIAQRFHEKAKEIGVTFDEGDLNPPSATFATDEPDVSHLMPEPVQLPETTLAKMTRLYAEGKEGEAISLGLASGIFESVDKESTDAQ